ncbi:hypothetical protein FACS1894217_14370 [Clostridia bacterium]|nr:hypothetical protein FACS1894217_14370 [Clostridia bacterium]
MSGREEKRENDLFFVCSLIEYIGRETKNRRRNVVQALGEDELARVLELADIYHCEPLENTASDLITRYKITEGDFDNVALCQYTVATHFDIAKVYKRLIAAVSEHEGISFIDALVRVYASWISDKIDDYNSSMYYENPQYLFQSYLAGEPLDS